MELGNAIIKALSWSKNFFQLMIFIRVVMSWVNPNGSGAISQIVFEITEPILSAIRRILQKTPFGANSMIDFSTFFAYFLIEIVFNLLSTLTRFLM